VMLLMYMLASMDRVNISFIALQMNSELGFTPEIYGFGAGLRVDPDPLLPSYPSLSAAHIHDDISCRDE